MIIALLGFMGTGKSSVGKKLAQNLNYEYYDTDNIIEKEAGLGIPEIFKNKGEAYFRQVEERVLEDVVSEKGEIVLSTGGGIVLSARNRHLLKEKTIPVLLQAGAEEIYNRIKSDTKRPLLAVANPLNEIKKLLAKRREFYEEFQFRVETDGLTLEEIVELIMTGLAEDIVEERDNA